MTTPTAQDGLRFSCKGFTNGGAPTTGSYVPGDWVVGSSDLFVCVKGGTPGTWTGLGATDPGTYAAIPPSPVAFTQTYSTTAATVPNATYAAPAVTAASVATADGSDAATTQALANALKVAVNAVIADNVAQNTALAALAADVLVLKKLINSLIDGQQAAGIATAP